MDESSAQKPRDARRSSLSASIVRQLLCCFTPKASKIADYAMDNDLTLKDAALRLGFLTEELLNRVVDPAKMVRPYVADNSHT